MFNFTVNKAKEYFERLGININITLRGKTLTLGDKKYKMPDEKTDTLKKINWDDKIQEHIRTIMPRDKSKEIRNAYSELLDTLKKSPMQNTFSYVNWGPYEPARIKKQIQNMRDFLTMIDSMENLDKILDDYEAYRVLLDRRFGNIKNE